VHIHRLLLVRIKYLKLFLWHLIIFVVLYIQVIAFIFWSFTGIEDIKSLYSNVPLLELLSCPVYRTQVHNEKESLRKLSFSRWAWTHFWKVLGSVAEFERRLRLIYVVIDAFITWPPLRRHHRWINLPPHYRMSKSNQKQEKNSGRLWTE
jgi:hypothetical protein